MVPESVAQILVTHCSRGAHSLQLHLALSIQAQIHLLSTQQRGCAILLFISLEPSLHQIVLSTGRIQRTDIDSRSLRAVKH